MQVPLETAYQAATAALGESTVRERLLNAHVAQLQDAVEQLQERLRRYEPDPEPADADRAEPEPAGTAPPAAPTEPEPARPMAG